MGEYKEVKYLLEMAIGRRKIQDVLGLEEIMIYNVLLFGQMYTSVHYFIFSLCLFFLDDQRTMAVSVAEVEAMSSLSSDLSMTY